MEREREVCGRTKYKIHWEKKTSIDLILRTMYLFVPLWKRITMCNPRKLEFFDAGGREEGGEGFSSNIFFFHYETKNLD